MFSKILVPVDGSAGARQAAQAAAQLAGKTGGSITLLHVVEIPPTVLAATEAAGLIGAETLDREGYEGASTIITETREALSLPEDRVGDDVVSGHPAEAICRTAEEGDYDLIVIGSRGLSDVAAFFLGSVSGRVSQHAPCSVLIVR